MEIRIDSLCKRFGQQIVFDGFSAHIADGEAVVFTGISGLGKSTLLRLLLGLETPDSGSIRYDGKPLPQKPLYTGVLFQEDRIFPALSAADNLRAVLPGVSDEAIRSALAELLPDAEAAKPLSAYSGGMKRRTALIRACLCPAPLVLLDEPFSGLDAQTAERAAAFIRRQCAGRTLIVAAHAADHLPFCREIALKAHE